MAKPTSIAQVDTWLDAIFDASSVEALIGTEGH
jgi:hypothetical protein